MRICARKSAERWRLRKRKMFSDALPNRAERNCFRHTHMHAQDLQPEKKKTSSNTAVYMCGKYTQAQPTLATFSTSDFFSLLLFCVFRHAG